MPLAERLQGKRICICAGPGGVGKTTSAAAIALGLAMRGQRVAVLTIDPAKRLADALGMDALHGEPQLVDQTLLSAQGIELEPGGELWALTLDVKGTFDALIGEFASDEQAREEVLANRIYQELSSAVAGSQEFTAVSRLYELDRTGDFDVIVLDTPIAQCARLPRRPRAPVAVLRRPRAARLPRPGRCRRALPRPRHGPCAVDVLARHGHRPDG